jgi:hypothetical protein
MRRSVELRETKRAAWGGMAALALLCTVALSACGGSDDKGSASDAPCGAPPGDWKYLLSCDTTFSGTVHECVDYYATAAAAGAVAPSFKAICQVESGTVLSSTCPSQNSVGSCLGSSSSGPTGSSPLAALERITIYAGSTTPAAYRVDCEKEQGVYVPPDADSSVMTPTGSADACSAPSTAKGGGAGGVAFSEETVVNGDVIECTNYVGKVSQAELDSVLKLGALTTPCPAAKAICSCAQGAGSGPFGTTPTLVYYASVVNESAMCPASDASCKSS